MIASASLPSLSAEMPPLALERTSCPCCNAAETRYERSLAGYALERCTACGLVFVNPRPTGAALTSLYLRKDASTQASFYARTVSPAQLWEYRRILRDLAIVAGGTGRLVDLGCAAGYFIEQARHAGFDPHGVDLARWVAEAARQRGIPNVHIGRIAEIAFPSSWADVVHSSQVLEHLPNPREELCEIRRILRPAGVVYFNVPNYRCLSIVLGRDDFELNMPPEHVTYFTPRTLTRLLTESGFKVVRTSSYGGLKWENLIGRRIRSEIAEAVRPGAAAAAGRSVGDVPNHGFLSRSVRQLLYRRLQFGMTLEIFAVKS